MCVCSSLISNLYLSCLLLFHFTSLHFTPCLFFDSSEQARVWGALERAKEEGKQKGGVDMQICAFTEVKAFVESLCRPRRILLSIPAGRAVDDTLDVLLPHMSEEDVVIDGGNEHFTNTERRAKKLMEAKKIHLVGMYVCLSTLCPLLIFPFLLLLLLLLPLSSSSSSSSSLIVTVLAVSLKAKAFPEQNFGFVLY